MAHEGAWDPIGVSIRPNGGRNSVFEGKGYALRGANSIVRGGDVRRRGNSEGGTASRVYSLASPLIARPPPKPKLDRKLVSEKCVAMAQRTQEVLFDAKELDTTMEDMTLWVHARVVPLKWRRQVLSHLKPIYQQMTFCREEVVKGWGLMHPPFNETNIESFERRLRYFERSVQLLTAAVEECKTKLLDAEAVAACRYIQLWTRRLLAKRGFYTKVIKLTYHHRGLVSGMFDSIVGTSKLTAHRPAQSITLEYPRSEKSWDSFS
ncbi:Pyruvate ferredoxin/flavodoxin oxidoreductase, beta subunit [Phytophthora cinnamomi]|uniref:Pyruvate ferredoxin/flavodoxin oxidoreductase, beta subunit n=1 Tax=Phytophthora cinnamomi TaxID=4785 RepID=UPI003559ABFF|nr:Pyruvate ferredoxin/flavodoxin oxidoreductase, beta subunit [Phytophthora cinnamomi]